MGMRVDIVTLFPEMCRQVLDASILGRAAKPVSYTHLTLPTSDLV